MTQTEMQKLCWTRAEPILIAAGVQFIGPKTVHGKGESYDLVEFSLGERRLQLFMYSNEAGILVDEATWTPFEAPDYKSNDQLAEAFAKRLAAMTGAAKRES